MQSRPPQFDVESETHWPPLRSLKPASQTCLQVPLAATQVLPVACGVRVAHLRHEGPQQVSLFAMHDEPLE